MQLILNGQCHSVTQNPDAAFWARVDMLVDLHGWTRVLVNSRAVSLVR